MADDPERTGARTGASPRLDPGRVGRFVLLERLGVGGMGAVWAAFDPDLDRRIALKILHSTREDAHPRLLREAKAMAKLGHPNVAAVHEVGTHDGRLWLAMEFVDGQTLRAWSRAEPRPWRVVLATYLQAARGLAAAHDLGIVHRDFKPHNAILGRDGRVRVVDFGLARLDEDASARHSTGDDAPEDASTDRNASLNPSTRSGALLGTPAYMAPEQWLKRPIDARADQFSFCVALWEAICGERPFAGDVAHELAFSVTTGTMRPPPAGADLPPWVRKVLQRGLSREPVDRFATMHALVAGLEADPTRARRRIFALGSGVACIGAIVAFVAIQRVQTRSACSERAQAELDLLDDASRAGIERAFLASGSPLAGTTLPRLEPWLDDHAQRWQAVAEQACVDAEVERTLDADDYAAVVECLDERREEFAHFVERLRAADARMVERAISIATGLDRIEPCADPSVLAHRVPSPSDESTRIAVAELRRELARGRALDDAGHYADAEAVLAPLVARADALAWDPIAALTRLRLAALRKETGDYDEAVKLATAAFHTAARSGADAIAAEAAIKLVALEGRHRARVEQGLAWADMAETMLARGGEDALMRAHLHDSVGTVHLSGGTYDEAIASHRAALAILERELGPDHSLAAVTLNNLGAALYERRRPEEALPVFTRALAISERVLGPDHPTVATTLSNLAGAHLALEDRAAALAELQRGLAIHEKVLGPEHPTVAALVNNIGTVRLAGNESAASIADFSRARRIWEEALGREHPEVARAVNNLARAHHDLGNYDEALSLQRHALALREKALGREHPAVAKSLEYLAKTLSAKGEHDAALLALERALAIMQASGEPPRAVASMLQSIAEIHATRGTLADAVGYFERALALLETERGAERQLASTRFAAAKTLWSTSDGRERAVHLARLARDASDGDDAEQIDAWLAAR